MSSWLALRTHRLEQQAWLQACRLVCGACGGLVEIELRASAVHALNSVHGVVA
jgi:hypothetical protein